MAPIDLPQTPTVTLIIINYNGRHFLEELLESIRAQSFTDFETLLIDNGSTDDSVDFVAAQYPDVSILKMQTNQGFARAGNVGARKSSSRYIVFLNADLKLDPAWLGNLVSQADQDSHIVAVAPKMRLYDRPGVLNGVGGGMNYIGYTWDRGMFEEDQGQLDQSEEVIFASAAAALFRRAEFLEVGAFDERFFMYHEDVDLGWRFWIQGFRIVTCPAAVVYHHFGGTTKASKGMMWRELLGERNNIRALLKNYELRNSVRAVRDIMLLPQPRRRKLGQIRNLLWNFLFLPETLFLRRTVQRNRRCSDHELKRLIVQSKHVPVRL